MDKDIFHSYLDNEILSLFFVKKNTTICVYDFKKILLK